MIRSVQLRDGAIHFDAETTPAASFVNEVLATPVVARSTVSAALDIALMLFEARGRPAIVVSDETDESGRRVVAVRVE